MSTYLYLMLLGLISAGVSALFAVVQKSKRFSGLPYGTRQLIFGLVFGIVSILNTEFGVGKDGMILNVRDAAPLCAGLLFGAPAGLMAGFIGGAERWLAFYWGAGDATRLACTLGTMLSGVIGAVFRKMIFEGKTPSWYYGLAIGLMTEVIHMLMVFITNVSNEQLAVKLLNTCAVPMVTVNALSVMLAVFVVRRIRFFGEKAETEHLTQAIAGRILLLVLSVSCLTCYVSYRVQNKAAIKTGENLMKLNIQDLEREAYDNADYIIVDMVRNLSSQITHPEMTTSWQLENLRIKPPKWQADVVHVTDADGNVLISSDSSCVGSNPEKFEGLTKTGSPESDDLFLLSPPQGTEGMRYAGINKGDAGYRIMIGFNPEEYTAILRDELLDITRNRHVGEHGFLLVLDENNEILNDERDDIQQLSDFFSDFDLGSAYTAKVNYSGIINGTDSFWMFNRIMPQNIVIAAVLSYEEACFAPMFSTYIIIFIQIFLFFILFIAVYILIKRQVVDNIVRVNAGLATITRGNLNESVNVRSHVEFITLSDGINATVDSLKGYIDEASARIEHELEIARTIQLSSLPRTFPAFPHRHDFDVYALMDPAREVGGDFYDFYMVDGNHLAFLIADVSGKGITAAMFMMRAKAIIKSYVTQKCTPAEALTRANENLCSGNDAEMFVTCWMGIMDLDTHTVTFANAGHNPPLVRRDSGNYDFFKSRPGMVLGGMEGIRYRDQTLQLSPGDEILLYTDGVTEATDERLRLYGDARLRLVANSLLGKSCRDLCHGIKENVDRFVGTAPQADDITMVSIRLAPGNTLRMAPSRDSHAAVSGFLDKQLQAAGVDYRTVARIQVAADELWTNIVSYSDAEQADLCCEIDEETVRLTFTDNGIPYNPLVREDPDISLSAEERPIGGLGIYMVKKTMDEVDYQRRRGQNILTIVKRRES